MSQLYDKQLKEIITKYGFDYKGIVDSTEIHNIILGLFQRRCLKKRVALWGAGRSNSLTSHASVILNKYASCLRGLVCVIDSAKELQGTQFMEYPVIAPGDIKSYNVELIIVASRANAASIRESIQKYAPWCEVLDIYEELRRRGIVIPYNFYEERSLYTELYDRRIAYEVADACDSQAQALRQLISAYLNIRDFAYALEYCQEYIEKTYDDYENVALMVNEITALIDTVKRKNQTRANDIIIHFIDALRAMDVSHRVDGKLEFDWLSSYFKDMFYFENAYSTAPTTYESMRSIICEEYPFSVNVYNDNFIYQFEEFKVLPIAYKKGYDIYSYTSEEYRVFFEDERINYVNQIHMTQKLWTMMCDRAETENPMLAYLYYPWELHFPLVCGYHRNKPHLPGFVDVGIVDMSDYIEDQFEDCLQYVDRQFEFYRDFYSKDTYINIFSDHSQIVYDSEKFMPYYMYYNNKERATHCTMAISGPGIKAGIYKENFSMIDYCEVLCRLIQDQTMQIPKRDILRWQYYSCHNKRFREAAEEHGYTDYIDGIDCYMLDGYIYSCTCNGKREVYKVGDTEHNLFETEKGQEIYKKVLERCGESKFPAFLDVHFVS